MSRNSLLPSANALAVQDLLQLAEAGKLRIPRFQRRFKWDQADVINLLDSVLHGYPIGTLLFWEKDAPAQRVTLGPVEVDAPVDAAALFVLDGQQRIAALVGALLLPPSQAAAHPLFNILFDLEAGVFVSGPAELDARDQKIPVAYLRDVGRVLEWFELHAVTRDRHRQAQSLIAALLGYRVNVYTFQGADEDVARKIFNRLNHTGKALSLAEVFTGAQPSHEADDLGSVCAQLRDYGYGQLKEHHLLKAVMVAEGHNVAATETVAPVVDAAASGALARVKPAVVRAAAFVLECDFQAVHMLRFDALFVALVRFFHRYPDPHPRNLVLLRRWLWRAFCSESFGGDVRNPLRVLLAGGQAEPEDDFVARLLSSVSKKAPAAMVSGRYDARSGPDRAVLLACAWHLCNAGETWRAIIAQRVRGNLVQLPRLTDEVPRRLDSVANHTLWCPPEAESWEDWATSGSGGVDLVLHQLSTGVVDLLRLGKGQEAVELRAQILEKTAQAFVAGRAEWEQEDRPPLRLTGVPGDNNDDGGSSAA